MGLATIGLLIQLAVGIYALVDQVRAFWRPWSWLGSIGRVVVIVALLPLSLDGLYFQTNLLGNILDTLSIDFGFGRIALFALLLVAAILWSRE